MRIFEPMRDEVTESSRKLRSEKLQTSTCSSHEREKKCIQNAEELSWEAIETVLRGTGMKCVDWLGVGAMENLRFPYNLDNFRLTSQGLSCIELFFLNVLM